jgi:pimeloyl-ACP methyl ester carboxylesterase
VPSGLAFSEFRGYEDWAVVAVHHTEDLVKVVVGNPMTMDAFRAGIPGNGKPFPDGSKMAKVEWRPKKSPDAPYHITVPGAVYDLDFMVKAATRFADSAGWGYAVFILGDQYRHLRGAPLLGERAPCLQGHGLPSYGIHRLPGEIYRAPRTWVEKTYTNLIYFHEAEKGGHFAAWEQPELFVAELRAAFRSLRRA